MQHQKLLRLVAVFLLSLSGLITAKQVVAEITAPAPQNQTDPLVTLNNAFRGEYSRAKTEALSKVGPLIIVEGTKAVLVRDGKKTEAEIQPPSLSGVESRRAYSVRGFPNVRSGGFWTANGRTDR